MSDLAKKKCRPCEGGVPPLSRELTQELLKQVLDSAPLRPAFVETTAGRQGFEGQAGSPQAGWQLSSDGKKISCTFKFKNFRETRAFFNKVADIADAENHHPDFEVSWGKCTLTLWTHAIGGLSENDFIVAAKVNDLERARGGAR